MQRTKSARPATARRAIAARNLVLVTKPADLELEKPKSRAHQDLQMRLKPFLQDMSAFGAQCAFLNELPLCTGALAALIAFHLIVRIIFRCRDLMPVEPLVCEVMTRTILPLVSPCGMFHLT